MAKNSIAVIVAHPDDEVLAFGGLMARHTARGDDVHVFIMATGLAARTDYNTASADKLALLREESRAALNLLGVRDVKFGDFPDNRMDAIPLLDVIKPIERFIDQIHPTTIYTHHAGDMNIDHTVIARGVMTACRPLPGSSVRRVYAGEVLSSSEYAPASDRFIPTSYMDITEFFEQKCFAMQCYRGEIKSFPHPRSVEAIKALATLRGSECGLKMAEGLRLLREVQS